MTDRELIDLLFNKTPAEFSSAEISRLRRRMSISPRVRAAFADRLLLEQSLSETLARAPLTVETIVAAAAKATMSTTTGASSLPVTAGSAASSPLPALGAAVVAAVCASMVPPLLLLAYFAGAATRVPEPATPPNRRPSPAVVKPLEKDVLESPSDLIPPGFRKLEGADPPSMKPRTASPTDRPPTGAR